MALGAAPTSVYRIVIGEAAWFIGAGVAIGTVSAVGVATMMRGLLFGVRSWDAQTLTIVCAVLTVSALVATYAPARRAASIDPLEVLRAD